MTLDLCLPIALNKSEILGGNPDNPFKNLDVCIIVESLDGGQRPGILRSGESLSRCTVPECGAVLRHSLPAQTDRPESNRPRGTVRRAATGASGSPAHTYSQAPSPPSPPCFPAPRRNGTEHWDDRLLMLPWRLPVYFRQVCFASPAMPIYCLSVEVSLHQE